MSHGGDNFLVLQEAIYSGRSGYILAGGAGGVGGAVGDGGAVGVGGDGDGGDGNGDGVGGGRRPDGASSRPLPRVSPFFFCLIGQSLTHQSKFIFSTLFPPCFPLPLRFRHVLPFLFRHRAPPAIRTAIVWPLPLPW